MKTSNKIFAATLALLLGSLTAYNATLRHEISQHHYRDPLYNYTAEKFQDFSEVVVPASQFIQVKIVAGPYGVRVHKDMAADVRVVQQGQQLRVVIAKALKGSHNGETVVVSCPRLARLTLEGAKRPEVEISRGFGFVQVQGFVQDSLALRQQEGTVQLTGNTLGQLRTVTTGQQEGGATLTIEADNRIQAADLTLAGPGSLDLRSAIPQLRYHLSGEATVTLSGAAARRLR